MSSLIIAIYKMILQDIYILNIYLTKIYVIFLFPIILYFVSLHRAACTVNPCKGAYCVYQCLLALSPVRSPNTPYSIEYIERESCIIYILYIHKKLTLYSYECYSTSFPPPYINISFI